MSRHLYKKICRSTICFDQISNYLFKCLSFSIAIASLLLSSLLFSLLPRPVIFFFTSETLSLSLLLSVSHHSYSYSYLPLTTPTPTFLSPLLLLLLPSSHHSHSFISLTGVQRSDVSNYDDVRQSIICSLEMLRDRPVREEVRKLNHTELSFLIF